MENKTYLATIKHNENIILKQYIALFIILTSIWSANSQTENENEPLFESTVISSTTCPIEIVKSAVELNSIELLKTAYSKRMVSVISNNKEWETVFKYWEKLELNDFSCRVDKEKIYANFFYKGNIIDGGMTVVMEKLRWKFDEK